MKSVRQKDKCHMISLIWGFPGGTCRKEHTRQCRKHERWGFDPWVGKIPWRRAWQPTPVFLPGEFHGQGSLVGYRPWGQKESDRTGALGTHICTCNSQLALSRPLPQCPQLLPYGPGLAANVCHEIFLEHVCSVLGARSVLFKNGPLC